MNHLKGLKESVFFRSLLRGAMATDRRKLKIQYTGGDWFFRRAAAFSLKRNDFSGGHFDRSIQRSLNGGHFA